MEHEDLINHKFNVGDKIRIKPNAPSGYSVTSPGSEGIITKKRYHGYTVDFYKILGTKYYSMTTWEINEKYMELINPNPKIDDGGNII